MLKEKESVLRSKNLTSLNNFTEILNANTVIGTPIETKDSTIIPVVKITVGAIGGGGEYGDIKLFSKEKTHPFAGGNGNIINIAPSGFLVCKTDVVSFVKVDDDLADVVFQKTSDLISKTLIKDNEK